MSTLNLILKKYINNEIYRVTVAILLVLILIFVSSRFVKYIQLAVDGTISAKAVFTLLALQVPSITGFLIPLSLFLAILLTFGRLYSDNELVVVHSLGIGQADLARMLAPVALVFTLIAGSLSTLLTPWAISQSKILMAEEAAKAKLGIFSAGRFRENINKDGIVFVESKSDNGVISGVFSVSRPAATDNDKQVILTIQTAKQGRQWENEQTGVNYLVLDEGRFYEKVQDQKRASHTIVNTERLDKGNEINKKNSGNGEDHKNKNEETNNSGSKKSGENKSHQQDKKSQNSKEITLTTHWQTTDFASSYTKILPDDSIQVSNNTKSTSTLQLFQNLARKRLPQPTSTSESSINGVFTHEQFANKQWAAIHWRFAAPISIPLITLLAILLARTRPRQGRFARLLPSVLIYLIYVLLMMYSRKLIESDKIPGGLGFWWIHVGLALFIYGLYRPRKAKGNPLPKKPFSKPKNASKKEAGHHV